MSAIPWLDAGIVAFSTLDYRQDRAYWEEWFPADLITEIVPWPVPQLVLLDAGAEHRARRHARLQDGLLLRPDARREGRGDAQEQGQRDLVRRCRRRDRRRRHALAVLHGNPEAEPQLRLPHRRRGPAAIHPAALELVLVLRHLRPLDGFDPLDPATASRWPSGRCSTAGSSRG